jgi:pilus assembly protein CpaB
MSFYTKLKIIITFVLAIIISGVAYFSLSKLYVETTVLVAVEEIPERTVIKPEMLKEIGVRMRERQILVPDSLTSKKEFEFAVSKVKITKGRIINKNEDIIFGSRQSLIDKKVISEEGSVKTDYFLEENKRIITVKLDSQGALLNKLNIGNWVDVIFTGGGDGEKSFSSVILQHVKIYDIQTVKEKGDASQNVSLLVTPQQAVDLTFAKRTGKLDLILNPVKGDDELVFPANLKKFTEQFEQKK